MILYGMARMTPADYVINLFGSQSEVARVLGIDQSAVSRWTLPRSQRGCGGDIPHMRQVRKLLEVAKRRGFDITESDLVHGHPLQAVGI